MEIAELSALLVSFGLVGLWAAAQFRAAACLGATAAAARLASSSPMAVLACLIRAFGRLHLLA